MRNYLKFVVAIIGITIATFGSIKATAKVQAYGGYCMGGGACGTAHGGGAIEGKYFEQ